MTDTPRLLLPELSASQAQKHVTHNDALLQLDAFLCCNIADRTLTAPPASPADGDTYLVKATATGTWAGQDGKIAYAIDGGWRFYAPFIGLYVFVANESAILVYTASGWTDFASVLNFQNVPQLGVNTAADATNKFAAKSNAILFAALETANGGNDNLHMVVNKATTAADAAILLQDNFSTRALLGLLGDDNLTFKVSPDGSTFHIGFTVDKDTGAVDHAQGAKFSAYLNYDQYLAAGAFGKIAFNNANHNDQSAFDGTGNNFTAPVAGYYMIGAHVTFKANATVPTRMMLALFVNGTEYAQSRVVVDAISDQGTSLHTTSCLKLAASDVVDARVQFVTNDGYILTTYNEFLGARVS